MRVWPQHKQLFDAILALQPGCVLQLETAESMHNLKNRIDKWVKGTFVLRMHRHAGKTFILRLA